MPKTYFEEMAERLLYEKRRQQGYFQPEQDESIEDMVDRYMAARQTNEQMAGPQKLRPLGAFTDAFTQSLAQKPAMMVRGATAFTGENVDEVLGTAAKRMESLVDPERKARADAALQGKLWPSQEDTPWYKIDPKLLPEVINTWAAQVGDQIPIMVSAVIGRVIGAKAGSIAGSAAGPGGALTGAAVGGLTGGWVPMAGVEADGFLREAQYYNIDKDIAEKYARIHGPAAGAIEYVQQLWNLKAFKGISQDAQKKVIRQILEHIGGNIWEGLEEVTQEGLGRYLMGRAIDEMEARYPGLKVEKPKVLSKEDSRREFGVGFGIGTIAGGAGTVRSEGARQFHRYIGQDARQVALTEKGAAGIARINPEWAKEMAEKEKPSRTDFEKVGLKGWSSAERQELSSLLKESLAKQEAKRLEIEEERAAQEAERHRIKEEEIAAQEAEWRKTKKERIEAILQPKTEISSPISPKESDAAETPAAPAIDEAGKKAEPVSQPVEPEASRDIAPQETAGGKVEPWQMTKDDYEMAALDKKDNVYYTGQQTDSIESLLEGKSQIYTTDDVNYADVYATSDETKFVVTPKSDTKLLDTQKTSVVRKMASRLLKDYNEGKLSANLDEFVELNGKKVGKIAESLAGPTGLRADSTAYDGFNLSEWIYENYGYDGIKFSDGTMLIINNEAFEYQPYSHRKQVEQAIKDGKPVPANVLADYPDLQSSFNPPAAKEGGTSSSIGKQALAATNEIDRKEIKVSLEPQGGKPMTAGEIVRQLERDFKIPIRGKATHVKKKALGWFSPREVGIRMKDVREITTATHEIGHHIDWTLNKRLSKNPPTKEIAAELTDLGKALYGSKQPAGGYKSEGWAEFMRMYLTGEDTQEAAPHLHDWFTGEYLPQHPDIAKNIARAKQMITNWRLQGADSIVDGFVSGKVKTPVGDMLERLSFSFHKNWRDKFHVLKKLRDKAGQLRPSEDPFELATAFSQKAPAKARQFVLEKTTDLAGNVTGKGLKEILAPIKNIQEFTRYAVAKRARLLNNRGIKSGLSDAVIDYTLNKYQSEQYDQVLKELTDWNHRVIDYLVEAGGMETKVASNIKAMNPVYVPFLRTFAEDEIIAKGGGFGKGFKPGKAVHKIKGSGREIKDIFESMILNTQRTIEIAHKSAVSRSIAKLADRPAMAGWIWKVPAPKQATSFSAEQLKKDIARLAVTKLGLDPYEINIDGYMEHWDDILTIYTNAHQYYGKDNIVSVVVDGQRQWFEVHPELYKAMEGIDQNSKDIIWKMLYYGPGFISRGVRLGATGLNPSFGLIRNFIRDAMTFSILRKHSKLGALGAGKGVIDDVRNTEAAKRFKALGGKMSGYIGQDRRGLKAIKSELFASNGKKYALHTVLHPVDALRELFGITETGVRIAEFEAAYKDAAAKYGEGTLDAAIYALNQAQDVTTNFTRHGVYAKYLNQLIPFFNAAIQGPDKIIRTFKERPIEAAIRSVAYLTIPAIGLWWKYKDEDWYENLPDYEKVNYLHFRVPGTEDTIVRLPVPFELGHVFQSLPVAALQAAYRDRKEDFTGPLINILDQANPFGSRWLIGGIPAVGIAVQLIANKDWAGRPIVPMSAQGRLPADQYGPYTTELMKHIGKALNVSPAKLEYAVNNLSGGLYRRTIRGAEIIAGQRDYETGLSDMPVIGTLFTRDPYAPQAQIERFYKRRDALNRKYQSKAITKPETRERAAYNKIGDMLSLYWKKLHNAKTIEERKEIYGKVGKLVEKAEGFTARTNSQKGQ